MTWPQPAVFMSRIWICAFLPTYGRMSKDAQSRLSLSAPVALRTTWPSTIRLTDVSWETRGALLSDNMMWSTLRWPQPPLLLSTILMCAFLPARSPTSHESQLRASPSFPVELRTTWPSTRSSTAVGLSESAGWLPPPMRKLMCFLSMVNSGDVSVPVVESPFRKVLASPSPRKPETCPWSGRVPLAGAVPKASPVAVQSP